jgi:hypothetical protein
MVIGRDMNLASRIAKARRGSAFVPSLSKPPLGA